jgi:toxin-antitoxin system PIN domain toxin
MVILDANILLYASIVGAAQYSKANEWLSSALSDGSEAIGIPWQTATAFLRISTSRRIFEEPFELGFAKQCLDDLFGHPLVYDVGPTRDHWKHYSRILVELKLAGDIVMDAHLAAIALEHNASIATSDKDFRRFSDYVKIIDPLAK